MGKNEKNEHGNKKVKTSVVAKKNKKTVKESRVDNATKKMYEAKPLTYHLPQDKLDEIRKLIK